MYPHGRRNRTIVAPTAVPATSSSRPQRIRRWTSVPIRPPRRPARLLPSAKPRITPPATTPAAKSVEMPTRTRIRVQAASAARAAAPVRKNPTRTENSPKRRFRMQARRIRTATPSFSCFEPAALVFARGAGNPGDDGRRSRFAFRFPAAPVQTPRLRVMCNATAGNRKKRNAEILNQPRSR